MATFRKVHTQFWSDLFIQSLSPERKYFYIYLLTNEKTRQCGIYEISPRQISFDTGYNVETVLVLLDYFIEQGKILVSRETNEIAIKNWDRYNGSKSPDVQNLVNKELKLIKNRKLIEWVQSVDRVLAQSKSYPREEEKEKKKRIEEEEEKEREKEGAPINDKLIYDAESEILNSSIWFEQICMAIKPENGKESLRKFHLFLTEKERYPQTKKQLLAGFEKWLLNEKKMFKNGTYKQLPTTRVTKSTGAEMLAGKLKEELGGSFSTGE